MRILNAYSLILLVNIFVTNNVFCQKFKILEEEKSFVLLEFSFDTTELKKIINEVKTVDFSKNYYCLNQINKPIVPLFNFTFELADSTLSFNIQHVEKSFFNINSIRFGEKSKKRGTTINTTPENSIDLVNISEPYVYRNFFGQNIQLNPIQFDSISKKLICFNKIIFKVYFDNKFKKEKFNSENSTTINLNKDYVYSFNKTKGKLKSLNPSKSELLIVFKDSNTNNASLLANWKNQKGIKTILLKINQETNPVDLKNQITNIYSNSPNLKYVLILGNHSEIPAYNYGNIDGDNYYSDSYYGQLTNDYYPELFLGRITGTPNEINLTLKKSIYYERENFEGDWMIKSIGIASNEGLGDGDNGESDWQHLRKIKSKLLNFGYSNIYEFYDGDHGENDSAGSPDKNEIIKVLNDGVSLVNYTGHGDDNLMLTSQLSSTDILNLSNKNKNPFIVSVACDNGKFTNNQGTLAEAFIKCKDSSNFTGAIAFCGSSILMDWAPPMLTQDEIVNTITSTDTSNFGYSIGELFYNSQMKMLNKYNSLGNGVMQTWILFGDPSIDLKSKIPQNLDFSYKYINNTNELIINSNTDNILLGISENNKYLNSYIINKGITKIIIDSFEESFLLTFTKPNFKTIQNNLFKTNSVFSEKINSINVYPNPIDNSNNKLVIYGINSFNSISLIDVLGNEQKIETQIESNNVFITFENLKSGIYFLNIIDNNYQNIIKRIVIN